MAYEGAWRGRLRGVAWCAKGRGVEWRVKGHSTSGGNSLVVTPGMPFGYFERGYLMPGSATPWRPPRVSEAR